MNGSVLGILTVLAAGTPSAVAAYWSYRANRGVGAVRQELVTGNGKTVGKMVAETHAKESVQATAFETH